MEEARFTMRVHPIIMQKMKFIAKQNGRSINKEIEQILKWVIDDYERKYGRIKIDTEALPKKKEVEYRSLDIPAALDMDTLFKP